MEQAVTPQALIQPIGTQWHSRKVCYYSGDWETVLGFMPEFELAPFSVGQDENPFLRTVIRLSQLNDSRECPIPVGAVSRTYCLVPHREVAKLCKARDCSMPMLASNQINCAMRWDCRNLANG